MTDEFDDIGPIDWLVVEFPGNQMTGEALPILVDMVDRGLVRVLDLVFVSKDAEGDVIVIEAGTVPALADFVGARSGLLDDDDIAEAAVALAPNCSAGILVYENRWAAPFAAAVRRGGGQLVASGRIPVQDIIDALDAQDAAG